MSKTGFSSGAKFVVERVMQDFLHVVPIRDDTKDAQYLYPALGWRHRNHHGGRVRPRKSHTGARSEVATPRKGQHTFEQKHLPSFCWFVGSLSALIKVSQTPCGAPCARKTFASGRSVLSCMAKTPRQTFGALLLIHSGIAVKGELCGVGLFLTAFGTALTGGPSIFISVSRSKATLASRFLKGERVCG